MRKWYLFVLGAFFLVFFLIFLLGFFASDSSLERVLNKGELSVGIGFSYGVMEFIDSKGSYAGIDVDIVKDIADDIGVDLKIVEVPWEELFVGLNAGDFDLTINSITVTNERKNKMLFSRSYFDGGQVAIVRSDDSSIESVSDLNGKVLGVQTETTSVPVARKLTGDIYNVREYVSYDSAASQYSEIVLDLLEGRIDAIVLDYIFAPEVLVANPELRRLDGFLSGEKYAVAGRLGESALMEEVNRILNDMDKKGRLEEIRTKWEKSGRT